MVVRPAIEQAQVAPADAGDLEERASAIAACFPELADHGMRVRDLASRIVEQLRPGDTVFRQLTLAAAYLHDLGKLAVSQEVLELPSRLTPQQRTHIERHAAIGANVVLALGFEAELARAIRLHHEWWNGEGYPDRLKGAAIPLVSRVVAVADAFDAMTTDRPYRDAMSPDAALRELERCSGTQFDPQIVAIVLGLYEMPQASQAT